MSVATEVTVATGDEAGTPPGDRRFRPDVQGLRAVAVVLVVLFHANIPGLRGGYVGVDVFYVISGFVITGVLLRERTQAGSTSLLHFYTRRIRRILPAASLVIIASVVAAYGFLGSESGNQNAIDARWASVFLVNVHFAATGTNYLASQMPPSVLQNYWSLAVEEQFYLVYPAIFLVVAGIALRSSLRRRIAWVLGVAIVASFVWSIVQTSNNPTAAFFSPSRVSGSSRRSLDRRVHHAIAPGATSDRERRVMVGPRIDPARLGRLLGRDPLPGLARRPPRLRGRTRHCRRNG